MAEANETTRGSPLNGLAEPRAGVEMAERPFLGKVNLRGDPDDAAFLSGARESLGVELPLTPNTWRSGDACTVYWLGPDEWLIHCADGAQRSTVDVLRRALAGRHRAVTDVSDYYVVLRLSGEKAREVLSKGTPLDVDTRVFGAGQCAQTRFGHASVLIGCVDDAPVFDVQVRWSFAEYVWNFLLEGAREYEAI